VCGGPELTAAVLALGLAPDNDAPSVALIDLRDPTAIERSRAVPAVVPRVVVAGDDQRPLLEALAIDPRRVLTSVEPAALGPALMSLAPSGVRSRTRVVVATGARGGVGSTLLLTNLARRLAPALRVLVVDATGSGAAAWWLRAEPRPWSDLESIAAELTADHLAVIAPECAPSLSIVGGRGAPPSETLLDAVLASATALVDVALVDAPPVFTPLAHAARGACGRLLLVAYDEPICAAVVADATLAASEWLIASQSMTARVGEHRAFRALARDERAVEGATDRRDRVGGTLGRAYDELASLVAIDAT
jgi:hypothetical protein